MQWAFWINTPKLVQIDANNCFYYRTPFPFNCLHHSWKYHHNNWRNAQFHFYLMNQKLLLPVGKKTVALLGGYFEEFSNWGNGFEWLRKPTSILLHIKNEHRCKVTYRQGNSSLIIMLKLVLSIALKINVCHKTVF